MRLIPVQEKVKAKESAIGVRDISGMSKAEALENVGPIQFDQLTPRQAVAVELVDKLVTDPHAVDDEFYARLRAQFSEEEIIDLVVASSLFTLAGTFNTVVRLDTDEGGAYPGVLSSDAHESTTPAYASSRVAAPAVTRGSARTSTRLRRLPTELRRASQPSIRSVPSVWPDKIL